MDTCLIIGNGLNRLYDNDNSWGSLVRNLAKDRGIEARENIPLPLEFERVMNLHLENKPSIKHSEAYSRAKASLAKKINAIKLPSKTIHDEIKAIGHNSLITTNYDFLLEKAVGVPNYTQRCAKKRSYISSSTCDYNGVSYYHPHGVVCNPSTMCLGYTHYLRITSDLIKVLSLKKGNKNSEMKILRHIRGNEPIDDHWGTKIYDSNCAFIGLGLTTCEIDLWWLLTHRASIIRQKIGGADTLVTNTIVYYDIINTQSRNIGDEQIGDYILSIIQAEMNKGLIEDKHKLLESMGVVVKKVTIKDSTQYEEAYKEIFKDIKNNGIDKQKREITIK